MKKVAKFPLYRCKTLLVCCLSFLFGCMIAINLYPIEKTCRIDDTDREFNIMSNAKLKNPELIVLILSAPKNLDRRNAIRETWLRIKIRHTDAMENVKFKMKHYFAVGSLGLSVDDVLNLSTEQSLYNDMLILPMQDSYKNLTYKVLKSFGWLSDQVDYGLGFKYVLKCDDDSFVRIDSLSQEVQQVETMYLKSQLDLRNLNTHMSPYLKLNAQTNDDFVPSHKLSLYWGYFNGKARIKYSGKWKEEEWILCDNYLPYALGGGYILSKDLVRYIARNADNLRLYNSEDVTVGAWLASVNNVLRIHDVRFDTEWKTRGCQNYHLISHSVDVDNLRKLYKNIIETGNLCEEETVERPHYLYNWLMPPSKCCRDL